MRRHKLTDEQGAEIEPLLPGAATGRCLKARRAMLNGIFRVLQSRATWRGQPERFRLWQTVYHHFNAWGRQGAFGRTLESLQA